MSKNKNITLQEEEYTCVTCGTQRTIFRRTKKNFGHKKPMYCPTCKRKRFFLNSISGSDKIKRECIKCFNKWNLQLKINAQNHIYICVECLEKEEKIYLKK